MNFIKHKTVWLKKSWNKLAIVVGVSVFAYNLLNFSNSYNRFDYINRRSDSMPFVYYYYSEETLALIAAGAALIAIGYLFRDKNN